MRPPARPKAEHRSAQHEGSPVTGARSCGRWPRAWQAALLCAALGTGSGCFAQAVAPPPAPASVPVTAPVLTALAEADPEAPMRADSRRYIVLAVDNPVHRVPGRAGSSLPGYAQPRGYTVGSQAAATLAAVQREHRLQEVAGWPIAALGLHCVVFELPPDTPREAVLKALAADRRVRVAQPLQDFATHAEARYNDPYLPLQRGFIDTGAAEAHRLSTGRGVTIALVDTGVDVQHPDLHGRIGARRNLVVAGQAFEADRHGTEVAGVIAAVANNRMGIVGIAPGALLEVYKACWHAAPPAPARCNSFTLAKALAAVLESDARVINLSLGGPADPLLQALLQELLRQRRIVVAALPPSGRREGFPAGVPGVIVVGSGDGAAPAGVLAAPGRDVLTLVPGGRYDFASGTSIAAAHASGIVGLLLALDPRLDAPAVQQLLAADATASATAINAEAVVGRLSRQLSGQ